MTIFATAFRFIHPAIRPVYRTMTGITHQLRCWYDVSRQRKQLMELDDRLLDDIGVSRDEALKEASRPFWDEAAAVQRRYGHRFHGVLARLQHRNS